MKREYRRSRFTTRPSRPALRSMPFGRSLVTPSAFRSRFERMLNGSPLLACRMIPTWLLFQHRRADAVVADTCGAITVDSENVCSLVERRDALVAIEIRRIGHAIVAAADDVGAGQRRVVFAARERVGRLRLPAVRHPPGHRRGERVVGRLADRLEHVDVVEGRVDARRGADRGRVDRPAVGQRRRRSGSG